MMVAMMLPPKAGRVCIRLRLSSMARPVQSAVRPVFSDGGHRAGQVAAQAGGAHEDDLGLVLVDQVADRLQVGFGAVVAEDRGVDQVDLVGAVGEGFAAEVLDLVADDDGGRVRLPRVSASSRPLPRSSQETLAASPSVCSTKTQTPR